MERRRGLGKDILEKKAIEIFFPLFLLMLPSKQPSYK